MASTAFTNNVRSTTLSGWQFGFDVCSNVTSISRTNNTIYINNLSTTVRINSGSAGISFYGYTVRGYGELPNNTSRVNASLGSGTFNRGSSYTTSSVDFSTTVSSTATSVSVQAGVNVNGGSGWGSVQSFSIPALGAPTGLSVSTTSRTTTTVNLNAVVGSWGTNATAGTGCRIEWKLNSASTWTNEAYSTSLSHTRSKSGLTPNTRYNLRSYAKNGGGKTANSSTINFDTLSSTYSAGVIDITPVSYTVKNVRVYQGQNATSTKLQYRVKGNSTWLETGTKAGDNFTISITGLTPNTTYERRFVTTTSAGTTTNAIYEFVTKPGIKIVHPGGTVQDAIPRIIYPDGTIKSVQFTEIDSIS